jgi:hypothetical protein
MSERLRIWLASRSMKWRRMSAKQRRREVEAMQSWIATLSPVYVRCKLKYRTAA